MTRHLLLDSDLSAAEQAHLLDRARVFKTERNAHRPLAGRSVALVFDKPSTRTRLSFEVGVAELGAHPLVIDTTSTQLSRGESLADTARVLSRYVHAVVWRTYAHSRLVQLAAAATIPIINGLTDSFHPCQALADLLTVSEHRPLAGTTLTYLGDGNNVAHSLLLAGALAGMHVRVACAPGFQPDPKVVGTAQRLAAGTGGSAQVTTDPMAAADGADVLYTDVWTSMGQEVETAQRLAALRPYALDAGKVQLASADVLVMHCLPAHRGEEIAAGVIDGPHSVVFDQAENRLHVQKALLAFLLEGASP